MTDKPRRRVKKSDTLQVRIPHETKRDFLDACREDDVAASDVIRGWIDGFLSRRQRPSPETPKGLITMIPRPIRKRRYLVAGVVAASAAALIALPSAAEPFRAMFTQLDANGDGKVTELEFMAKAKSFLPEDARKHLVEEIRKSIAEAHDPEKSRLDPALHEALRRGERTVESLLPYELEKIAGAPSPMPKDRLDRLRKQIKDSLGKPRRKEYLPPQNPKLLAAVEKGERTVESLSQQELRSLIPIWNDKDFPVHGVSVPHEEITDLCNGPGISDAEFANPWMNSNPDDMRKMYIRGDRNRDGLVTFEEFQVSQMETARQWFASMDEDSDGTLSAADMEISRARWERYRADNPDQNTCPIKPDRKPRWVPLDANRDGKVTFEEYLIPAQLLDPR